MKSFSSTHSSNPVKFQYTSINKLDNRTIPKNIKAFGINFISHQICIGDEEYLKLYSTITHKKLNVEIPYAKVLLELNSQKLLVRCIEALVLING